MTALSRRDTRRAVVARPTHLLPGPAPLPPAAEAPPAWHGAILIAGWVLFLAGLAAVAAGLAGAPMTSTVVGIVLIAVAGLTASIDPAPARAGVLAGRLKALLLSGLSDRPPF